MRSSCSLLFLLLLPAETFAPLGCLFFREFLEEGDGLSDGFGFRCQAQEYLSEVAIVQYFSKLGVVVGAFFEAEQEVDFGAGGGHVGFDEE